MSDLNDIQENLSTNTHNDYEKMDLSSLEIFPLLSKILSVKYHQISNLLLFFYFTFISKLKLKSVAVKSVSAELFQELILQSSYKFDFFGDLYTCGLLSVNTLVALSVCNKSWLKVTNFKFDVKSSKTKTGNKFTWKISMPAIESQKFDDVKNHFIKCYCVSNLPKDFVIYVTDTMLFNLSNQWDNGSISNDSIGKIDIELIEEDDFPVIAKSGVVSGITTENEIPAKDYSDVLDEYFKIPRFLKIGDLFTVSLANCTDDLQCRPALCNLKELHYKVINLKGNADRQYFYVLKGYTDLYLNPTVHSFLPPKRQQFIKSLNFPGYDISYCPDGLKKYFEKIIKVFRMVLKGVNIEGMLLLSGPKGSGKTTVLKSVASSLGVNFLQVNCFDFHGINPSMVQGKLDQVFAKARRTVPCILFFKNIELIGREQNYNESTRLIDIFLTHIKELQIRKPIAYPLLAVGATNVKPSEIVPAVARLFIHTVYFEPLNTEESYMTLNWAVKNSNMICSKNNLKSVVDRVRAYVFSDLVLLIQHAAHIQAQEFNSSRTAYRVLQLSHLRKGIEIMEAAYSESIGAARVPTVKWDDIGGLDDLKEEITLSLNFPFKHPELFATGLKRSGILFYGPPGTGKTLMAKAVATECNYNFLSVKGPELMNMYVGQSEKNVREVFERARDAAPCIIFFDELDSLAPSRGKSGDSGGVTDRVVSQLLAEMDGLDKNKNVFVIAATNRPDLVDPALLRPGRFDKMFYVGVCSDKESKLSVFKALTKNFSLSSDVDFEEIIKELPNQVTGADLYSVCSNAWFAAVRKAIHDFENGVKVTLPLEVTTKNFSEALEQFVPSLTYEDVKYYEELNSSK